MALINDDVAEVVLWIVFGEKVGGAIVRVHIQRLLGRNQDAGIFLGIIG